MQGRLLTLSDGNKEKDLKNAIARLNEAISLDPSYSDAYAKKAFAQISLYWFIGRDINYRDAALGSLAKAKELAPDNFETLMSEAFYHYWGLRDFRGADRLFDQALKLAPNNVDALAGKAFIDRRLGRFKSSAKDLTKAHRLDPKSFYLLPELGLTYALIGEFDKSNAMIAKAKAIRPDSIQGSAFEAAILQFQGDAIGAYNALSSTGTIVQAQKTNYAIATRNPAKIKTAIEAWPDDMRSPEGSPEAYNIAKIRALLATGQSAKKELAALKKRTSLTPHSTDWSGAASYSPIVIPGLLGDLEAVKALAQDYDKNAPDDAMAALTLLGDIAEAFARCGAPDEAMNYLDKMRDLMGPHIYLLMKFEPGLDDIRTNSRYLAYKANYAAWVTGKNG